VDEWSSRIHPHDANYLSLQAVLADLLQTNRRFDEAEAILKRVIPLLEEHVGPSDGNTTSAINTLAVIYRLQDRINEALPLAEKLVTIAESSSDPFSLSAARGNYINVLLYLAQNEKAAIEADLLAQQVRKDLPPNHQIRGYALLTSARVYSRAGRSDDALRTAEEAYSVILLSRGPAEYNTEVAAAFVRDLYTRKRNAEKMQVWIPRPFAHRLILAGDNEGESLTKGYVEVFSRFNRLAPTPDSFVSLQRELDAFVPAGHPRRARGYINLARAVLTNGLGMHAWTALRIAEGALSTSDETARDRELFIQVLQGLLEGSL
jgi:tetratricopeptide (TPR) repeat protein